MDRKLKYEQIKKENRTSLRYAWIVQSCMNEMPLLFHPEIEIKYIVEGAGYRMTGNYLEPFQKGELVLTPSNLPHCWIYNPDSCVNGYRENIIVQFSPEFLQAGISFFPEWEYAAHRLLLIQESVKITGKTSQIVVEKMKNMQQLDANKRLLVLIEILQFIGTSKDLIPIGIQNSMFNNITKKMWRMQLVYKYIIENYKDRISLQDIAKTASMSKTAFCSFFKRETGKTLNVFINEYRIDIACNLLKNYKNVEINEIAWKCGFTDIPYFNRYFKKSMGVTPTEWRNQ